MRNPSDLSTLQLWEQRFTEYLQSNMDHGDGSHDLGHFRRVWRTAQFINQEEGGEGDELVLLAAAMFHDLVALPKNHPERHLSSRLSAERTVELLRGGGIFAAFPGGSVEGVRHAVHAHSFSAKVEPVTVEAKILQDADRLEALGAIGLARVFYTAGQLGQPLFDEEDPLASRRAADDRRFSLDHFELKLLKLPGLMNTKTGRKIADERAAYLRDFLTRIAKEISYI